MAEVQKVLWVVLLSVILIGHCGETDLTHSTSFSIEPAWDTSWISGICMFLQSQDTFSYDDISPIELMAEFPPEILIKEV